MNIKVNNKVLSYSLVGFLTVILVWSFSMKALSAGEMVTIPLPIPEKKEAINPAAPREGLANYISKRYHIKPSLAQEIVGLVEFHSEAADFPRPDLIFAVIAVESSFDPDAVSYAGAQGLMQVMPVHKADGSMEDNIIKGIYVLKTYRSRVDTYYEALIAYNIGIGAFKRGDRNFKYPYKVLKAHKNFTEALKNKF